MSIPSIGRERIVEATTDDVVGDPRGQVRTDAAGAGGAGEKQVVARAFDIHVEVLDLGAPAGPELPLDAAADGPADPGARARTSCGNPNPAGRAAEQGEAGLKRAVGKAAGRIQQRGGSYQEA